MSAEEPVAAMIAALSRAEVVPFHTPGHGRGRLAPRGFLAAAGRKVLRSDLTELPGTDNLHAPQGAYRSAQERAARLFGARESFFLVNGATSGVLASFLALLGDGDSVVMPRRCHKSAFDALVLSGASPFFLDVPWDPELCAFQAPTSEAIKGALRACPRARALFLTSPTYHGSCADVGAAVEAARGAGVPVIVDEAWGAHFAFHPELPPGALHAGADVVIHSAHKILPAMTQTGIVHACGDPALTGRLASAVSAVTSTSPSSVLLASLDGALALMEDRGEELFGALLALARSLRAMINEIDGFRCFGREMEGRPGIARLDETRLIVSARGRGLSGRELERILRERRGIYGEAADGAHVLLLLNPGHTGEDGDILMEALGDAVAPHPGAAPPACDPPPDFGPLRMRPRDAWFASHEAVRLQDAVGRIVGESVVPYPPGVPLAIPGEEMTEGTADHLAFLRSVGIMVTGLCGDGAVPVVSEGGAGRTR